MPALPLNLPLSLSPAAAVRAWPAHQPLIALCSGSGISSPAATASWARWSLLAQPDRMEHIPLTHPDPLAWLREHLRTAASTDPSAPDSPFAPGWGIALSYDLGRIIEPAAQHRAATDAEQPFWPFSIVLWRCTSAFVFDHHTRAWSFSSAVPGTGPSPEILAALAAPPPARPFSLSPALPAFPDHHFHRNVRTLIDLIHAGDVFQANLSHPLRARASGSARALFERLMLRSGAWYGAYLEAPGSARHAHHANHAARINHFALSASPELFLRFDARTRRLTTRPIKGTRTSALAEADLRDSLKDQAELNMIIDLMRNDLGRVADFASVRVDDPRALEVHADSGKGDGVRHGVATISCTVRPGLDFADILRATFPPGSITGAPKVRAMQIIDQLEPSPRALYTGALGFISDSGDFTLNVAIRTALLSTPRAPDSPLDHLNHANLEYRVGAGIVADSVPEDEWQETLHKAAILTDLP